MVKNPLFSKSSKPISSEDMAKLWAIMASMFGGKWVDYHGAKADEHGVWRAGLKNLGPDRIKIGLNRLVDTGEQWPPSLPAFVELCKPTPQELGLPSCNQAMIEALEREWSPLSFTAYKQLPDGYNWRKLDQREGLKQWEKAYNEALKLEEWQSPPQHPQLPEPQPMSLEESRKCLQQIQQKLSGTDTTD